MSSEPSPASASAAAPSKGGKRRGYAGASVWKLLTFGWCSELVRVSNVREAEPSDVNYLLKPEHHARQLAAEFDKEYARRQRQVSRVSLGSLATSSAVTGNA